MPEISPDGRTIKFKILPHYLEDIKARRKKADVRKLSDGWATILKVAEYAKFTCPETGDWTEKKITNKIRLSSTLDYFLPYLFSDVDLKCKEDEELFLIAWE